jgi:tRNA A37 methylthiotransferase MiaB
LVKGKAHLFHKSFIGKKVTVLIEERKQADGLLKGHSEHYIPVRVDAEGTLQNQLVSVLITEVQKNELVGYPEQ